MKQSLLFRNFFACLVALLVFAGAAHAAGEVTVFPNPSTDKISLRYLPVHADASYVVTAITGNVVREGTLSSSTYTTVAVDDLPSGIYLVNVTDGDRIFTAKFIRQ